MRKLALPLLVLVLASLASATNHRRKYSAQPRLRAYRQLHDVLEQRRSPSNAELTDVSESVDEHWTGYHTRVGTRYLVLGGTVSY
jgi:hypothetical protein